MTTFADEVVKDTIKGIMKRAAEMGRLSDPDLRVALLSPEHFALFKRSVLVSISNFGSVADIDAALAAVGAPTDEAMLKTLIVNALDDAAEGASPSLSAVN